ncbi:MAG: 2-C-methyl-D-erythritol 4-phosphate cytidylyltransferase [Cyclobacteriaceae bacterium]
MSQNSVIIVAGGTGSRMNQVLPKQFTLICNQPVLVHTIRAFLSFDSNIKIILALPENHIETWKSIQDKFLSEISIRTVIGGKTRFQSVKNGLKLVAEGIVAIHDAVRPCIDSNTIGDSFESAKDHGSGVVCVPLKDSIRQVFGESSKSLNRVDYKTVQTPQTFQVSLIKKAFEAREEPFFTDDASVYEYALNKEVRLVNGNYTNIKITTPEDLDIATLFLKNKKT